MLSRLPDRLAADVIARRLQAITARRYDLPVLSSTQGTVTVPATVSTTLPGRYGLLSRGGALAQVGEILDVSSDRVTRELVTRTAKVAGQRMSWTGAIHASSDQLAGTVETVDLSTEGVPCRAWVIAPREMSTRWSVHMGGLGADARSSLRSAEVALAAGQGCMVLGIHRRRRHGFGVLEVGVIRRAFSTLRDRGATSVTGFGWSFGALAMLLAHRLAPDPLMRAFVLVSPLLDWFASAAVAAAAAGIRPAVLDGAVAIAEARNRYNVPWFRGALQLDALPWPADRPLAIPALLLHSRGDQTNPFETTHRFAGSHEEDVTLIELPNAPHTLEWNANEYAVTQAVSAFLRTQ
ncbi:alpha/beta hydrolase [Pseudolysinimonas yzui]|uniref:Alpha/beta hydrolase n=1 Tax=Pseudolysinimonas yzui TaxID=2708254 RepID=A0A8J3M155_9MICO|nr:alpha/beta hydrolase [Pseudolysinimonas yzui]GHF12595.1 alpha/beta hydrolase [Pseudolysinimonas yzui]